MRWSRRRHRRARKQQRKLLAAFILAAKREIWAETRRLEALLPLELIERALDAGQLYEAWLTRELRSSLREHEACHA